MKNGFKDPIEIKGQKPQDKPKDAKNSPWDFRCPEYDQRSSCYVKAGVDYGTGYRTPVGSESIKQSYEVLFGRARSVDLNEKIY
jgi:hypothetical protein